MWVLILTAARKLWPYLLGAGLILGLAWWVHHRGYELGYAASEAIRQAEHVAAEHELAAANARTKAKETESTLAVAESQRRIDETRKTLDARLADADSRLRALSLRYTAAATHRCDLPQTPGSAPSPDAATRSVERAGRAAEGFRDTGGRCERDAARLAEIQRLYTEQRGIINQ